MWAAMMTAMMLPSASPMLMLYAGLDRRRAPDTRTVRRVYAVAAGYVLVWVIFSAVATLLQRLFSDLLVLTPMMEVASLRAGGVMLVLAGIHQLTPLKSVCLGVCDRRCRSSCSAAYCVRAAGH